MYVCYMFYAVTCLCIADSLCYKAETCGPDIIILSILQVVGLNSEKLNNLPKLINLKLNTHPYKVYPFLIHFQLEESYYEEDISVQDSYYISKR